MIPKSVKRFSEKIMLKQKDKARGRFEEAPSRLCICRESHQMYKKLAVFAVIAAFAAPLPALAQAKKDSVVMGMTLEPPGLDPTNAAAAAIAEVTLYNIYETLTKVNEDGSVSPLLAESWKASEDLKTYTFKLRKGVKFH